MSDASSTPVPADEPARDFAALNTPLYATPPAESEAPPTPAKRSLKPWQKIAGGVAALGIAFGAGFGVSAATSSSSTDTGNGGPPGMTQDGYGFGGGQGGRGQGGGFPGGGGQGGQQQGGTQDGTQQGTTGQGT